MDADLQDDPAEIPALLATLQEGYDLVCSWKRDRQDTVPKRLLSLFFNASVTFATGVKLHDINSGLKAYRRDVVRSLKLYGHMHRFIPVLAHDLGYRIAEIPVNHFPRAHGQSKYGWERIPHGIMDLLTVMILSRYATRPGHLFGGIGFLVGVPSVLALLYLMLIWITGSGWIGGRPLLFFSLFGTIMAAQFILFGLLVEMVNSNLHTQRTRTIIWEEKSALETKQ
jgi:dolichol-phosphate mannosyltransferase